MKTKLLTTFTGLMIALAATGCRGATAALSATPEAPAAGTTASPTVIATLTPRPTQPGEPTPTWTERPAPTEIPRLCEHDYFKAVVGERWSYDVQGSPAGDFSFTQQVNAVRADSFSLTNRIADNPYRYTWACAVDGLTAQQFDGAAAAGIALAAGQITLNTDSVEGLSLPAEIEPGDRWQQIYMVSGVQSLQGLPDANVSGAVTINYEVIGMETISVPYGTFDTLHLRAYSIYDLRVGNPPFSFRQDISGISDIYYAPSIGLIRVVTDLDFMGDARHTIVELTDYSFP